VVGLPPVGEIGRLRGRVGGLSVRDAPVGLCGHPLGCAESLLLDQLLAHKREGVNGCHGSGGQYRTPFPVRLTAAPWG